MSVLDWLSDAWDKVKQNVSNAMSQTYDTSDVDWGGGTGNAPTQERQTVNPIQETYDTAQYDYGGYTSPTPTPTYNDYVDAYSGGGSSGGGSSYYEPSYSAPSYSGPSAEEVAYQNQINEIQRQQEAQAAARQKAQQEIYDRFRLLDEQNRVNVNDARKAAAESQMRATQNALSKVKALNTNIVPDFIRNSDTYQNLTEGSDAQDGFTLGDLGNTMASNLVGTLQNITSDLPAGIADYMDSHAKNVLNQIDRGQNLSVSDVLNSNYAKRFDTSGLENTNAGDLIRNSTYTNSLLQAQQELAEASALNNSKIGEFVGSIATQAPNMAAGVLFGPAASLGLLGANVWGGGMQNSLEEGHTIDEAMRFGLLDAGKEILTEKLNPNIPGVDNLKIGDIIGEGMEEAVGTYLDPFVSELAYGEGNLANRFGNALNADFGGALDYFGGRTPLAETNFGQTLANAGAAGLEGALSSAVINVGTHPVSTVQGAANTVMHPVQTAQNEYHALTDRFTGQSDYTRAKAEFEKDLKVLDAEIAANPNNNDLKTQRTQRLYDFEDEQRKLATPENLKSEDDSVRRMAQQANIDLIETSAKATDANVDQQTLNTIGRIANKLGVNVSFSDDVMFEDRNVQGLQKADGSIELNSKATDPIATIFAHELAHDTAGTQAYDYMLGVLFQMAEEGKIKTDGVDTIQNSSLDEATKRSETLATLVQNAMGNQTSLNHLAGNDLNTVRYMATQLKNFVTGDKQSATLARAERAMSKAIENARPTELTSENAYQKGENRLIDVLGDVMLMRTEGTDAEAADNVKFLSDYASQLLDPSVPVTKNDTPETIQAKKDKKYNKLLKDIETQYRNNKAYDKRGIKDIDNRIVDDSVGNQGYITEEELQNGMARLKKRVSQLRSKGVKSIKTGYEDQEIHTYNSEESVEYKKNKGRVGKTPIERLKSDSNAINKKIHDPWAKTEFGYVWELERGNRKTNNAFAKNLEANGVRALDEEGIPYELGRKPASFTRAEKQVKAKFNEIKGQKFETMDALIDSLNSAGFLVSDSNEFNSTGPVDFKNFEYEDGLFMAVPEWETFEHKAGDELAAMEVFSVAKKRGSYVIEGTVTEPIRTAVLAEFVGDETTEEQQATPTQEETKAEPKPEDPVRKPVTLEDLKTETGEEAGPSQSLADRFGIETRKTPVSMEDLYDETVNRDEAGPTQSLADRFDVGRKNRVTDDNELYDTLVSQSAQDSVRESMDNTSTDTRDISNSDNQFLQAMFNQINDDVDAGDIYPTSTPLEAVYGQDAVRDMLPGRNDYRLSEDDAQMQYLNNSVPEAGDLSGSPLYGDVSNDMIESLDRIRGSGEYPDTADRRLRGGVSQEIAESAQRVNESGNKPNMPTQEVDTDRIARRQLNEERRQTGEDVSDEIFNSVERVNRQAEETGEYPNTARRRVNENISPEIEESVRRINESGNKPNMPEQDLDTDRIARESFENGAVHKPVEKLTRAQDLTEGQTFYTADGKKMTFDGLKRVPTKNGRYTTRYLVSDGSRQWEYTYQRINKAIDEGRISAKPFIPKNSPGVKWLSDQLGYNAYSLASRIAQNPKSVNLSGYFFTAKDTPGALQLYPKNTEGYRSFQEDVYSRLGVENPYKEKGELFTTNADGSVTTDETQAKDLEDRMRSNDANTAQQAKSEAEEAIYGTLDQNNTHARDLARSWANNIFDAAQDDERAYKMAGIDSEKTRKAVADVLAKYQLKDADNTGIDTQAVKGPDTKLGEEAQKLKEDGDVRTKHKVEHEEVVKAITKAWYDSLGDNAEQNRQKAYTYFMAKEFKTASELINAQDGNRMQYWLDQNAEYRKNFMEKNGITTSDKGVYMKDGQALDMKSDLGKQLQKIDDMGTDITLKNAQHGSTIARALKQRQYFMSDAVLNKTKRAMLDQQIDELNEQNKKTFKSGYESGKWKELGHITDEEWRAFEDAKTNKEKQKALENIYKRIGENIPATFAETWFQQWRYMAMLANPRTHFKNIGGNAGMQLLTMGKNVWAYAIEEIAVKTNPELAKRITRYHSFSHDDYVANSSAMKKAINDWYEENVRYTGELGTGKYVVSPTDYSKYRNFFHKSQWNLPGRALDWIAKKNNSLLQLEDDVFTGYRFKTEFSKLLRHNGYDATPEGFAKNGKLISDEELNKFKEMALKEAKETTFHDENELANLLNKIEQTNLATKIILGAEAPFKATPLNIGRRMLEYQPIGTNVTIGNGYRKVMNGEMTANDYINSIAKRSTGSTLFALGLWMAAKGMIRAHGDRDDDWKEEAYKESVGLHQDYSFVVPKEMEALWRNKSDDEIAGFLSLENLGPDVTAVMMAAEAYEIYQNHGIWNDKKSTGENILNIMDNIWPFIGSMFQPLSDMSMMQGPVDTFESVANAATGEGESEYNIADTFLGALGQHITDTYIGQFFPSVFGAINRITDPIVRTSYSPSATESTFRKMLKKTLVAYRMANGMSDDGSYLEPLIDVRGDEVTNGDSLAERAFNNLINPLDYKKNTSTDADRELLKLADETDNTGIIPYNAKTVYLNDEAYKLSSEGRTEVNQKSLKAYQEEIKSFFNSDLYDGIKQAEHEPIAAGILKDVKNHEVRMADADYFNSINLPGDSLVTDKDKTVEFLKDKGMFDYQTYDTLSIKNDLDADGESISNSGAIRKRVLYESYGVWDDIVTDINAHKDDSSYAYNTYGLNKTVVKYSPTQLKYEYETMLEKSTGMQTSYDKLLKGKEGTEAATEGATGGKGKGNTGSGSGGTGKKSGGTSTKKSYTYSKRSSGGYSRRSSGGSSRRSSGGSSRTTTTASTKTTKPTSITAADKQAKEDAELYEKALKGALKDNTKTTTSQIKSSLKSAMKSDQDLYDELVANHKKMLKQLDLWGV